jgi:hypothetical protein
MPAKVIEAFCYMIINSRGRVRATKNKPDLQSDEVAVRLAFTLPEIMFARPLLQAKVSVSEAAVAPREISPEVVINTAELLEQQLGMKVQLVVVPPEDMQ